MTETRLLILGIPRSGTTLLTGMIGAHPEVAMLKEDRSNAIHRLVGKPVVGNKLCVPNHIGFKTPLLTRVARRFGYKAFRGRSIYSLNEYLQDERLKLIIIVRDPEATIASMMRRGGLSFTAAGQRWERGTDIAHTLIQSEAERTLLVAFERLVTEPEAVMDTVCRFLQIAYTPHMLDGWQSTPYTSQGGIQADKAQASRTTDLPAEVATRFPTAYERYQSLREQCPAV